MVLYVAVINGTFPTFNGSRHIDSHQQGGMTYTTNPDGNDAQRSCQEVDQIQRSPDCTIGVVQNGSWVPSLRKLTGARLFDVFDNGKPYEVRISKGGMSIYLMEKGDTVKPDVKQLTIDTAQSLTAR